jgi:porphobilinogen synthase
MRRLRGHPGIRRLVAETRLSPSDMILPLFVRPGEGVRQPVGAMPGVDQISPDLLPEEIAEARALGLGGVILFGIPELKDTEGSEALSEQGVVAQALRAARKVAENLPLITDVCFCEYTDHGHCGPLSAATGRVDVDNDATLELLGRQAVLHAREGADVIAPSGMMDGMVGAIRAALDAAGFDHIPILSYAAKYASAFYGPFREAAESAPQSGDRRGYQMDPAAAADQALREVALDLQEGADMVMVKPALAYLDIIARVADAFPGVPLAGYNVSGEFSMVKAAAERGWIDEPSVAMELLGAIRRAGAQMIITYWAKDAARWLGD